MHILFNAPNSDTEGILEEADMDLEKGRPITVSEFGIARLAFACSLGRERQRDLVGYRGSMVL